MSEILPGLYRAVLDAVADLEHRGRRREAAAIREEATKVYSTAWTPAAERRLRILQARSARVVAKTYRAVSQRAQDPHARKGELEQTIA